MPGSVSSVFNEPPYAEPHVRWWERAAGATQPPARSSREERLMQKNSLIGGFAACTLLALTAAIAAPGKRPAGGSGLPRYGVMVYSDLCVHGDSGEFGGQRVTLQRFAEADTVIYEYTAGGLSWPLVATDV